MPTINEARVLIYDEFISVWNNETPFDLDNKSFTEPESTPWVRTVVRNTISNQDSLGPVGIRKFLRVGSVLTQIFTPIDTGVEESDRLSEIVRGIFEGVRLTGGLWFFATDVRELGRIGDYYQVTVESTFNYEQTK
ncbi:MAG: hypothetical protein IIC74_03115 [Bacteroidetes bacterium]|nr:hypothetical protein [Bacteroidota bacterium]